MDIKSNNQIADRKEKKMMTAQIRITENGSGFNQEKVEIQIQNSSEGVEVVRKIHDETGKAVCISFGGYNADFAINRKGEEICYRGFKL